MTEINHLLESRKTQDNKAEPMVCFIESKILHALLSAIHQRLSDPTISPFVKHRLREDINSEDLPSAINMAKQLIAYNERRYEESLKRKEVLIDS